ncbi:MAG: glycosyltransferase family 4 protein [Pyrinomonadaceae bacterium]|jgi:glycosyltransferase involved in cell wall biosynthesis|nr:glycosyltransferase family 4 protein [Pyrinomonadaceae bacterium]
MKILLAMPSKDSWGGPISSEPPFADALRKLGENITEEIYVYGDKDKPTPILERIRRVWSTAFRFRKLLQTQDFDIIHFNTAFDFKTILRDSFSLFVMNPKAKILFKLHGSEAEKFAQTNLILRFLINYLKRKVDAFGVHTSEEKANFLQLGFDEKKFFYVKNAVTIHENLDANFTRKIKAKDEVFEFLFVSRFIPAKGLIQTIQACEIVKKQGFNFILNCVGDGEVRAEAEKEVERLGLQSVVKFTGYIPESEVTNYFFNSDLLIFPTSHTEGFPNILFKAVAVGMSIVTTKIRASADYLIENEHCLFCTQNPENIAEKIIVLLNNENLRRQMSEANIKLGKTLLPEAIAKEFIEIYQKM